MSFNFGTPTTNASMGFTFGTPAGDAKSTKPEPTLFGSATTTQNMTGFSFSSPTLSLPAAQSPPLFSSTFGSPNPPTFGTGTPLLSANRTSEETHLTNSSSFGAAPLITTAPPSAGAPVIQPVLPTYTSSVGKTSSGSGLLGAAFQSPSSLFSATSQSSVPTFAVPAQSTTASFSVPQSTLAPAFGATTQGTVPSYGIAAQPTAASSFGIPQSTAAPAQFSFGTSTIAKPKVTAPSGSFIPSLAVPSFTASTAPSTQPALSMNFGAAPAVAPTVATFNLGSNTSSGLLPSATTISGLPSGIPATTNVVNSSAAPLDFGTGALTTTGTTVIPTAVSRASVNLVSGGLTGSSMTKSPMTSLPSFGIATSINTSATPTFSLGATAPITSVPNTLGSSTLSAPTTTAIPATTFTTVTPSITSGISTGFTVPDGATAKINTTTVASIAIASPIMTYGQLEDSINKWTLDLENQCKIFANQAKQLNAWDRLLISNGDKILNLNNSIERVKGQQHQLDQELDFIRAQQKELEHLIVPLEKELQETPVTDTDRNHTYQLAEGMDSQLKQMSEDLKEIIETLNESNKNQEMSNPVTQIGRILNAHMNSLQWIDVNTNKISSQLDQISKMHELNRRNHEIVLQRTYD